MAAPCGLPTKPTWAAGRRTSTPRQKLRLIRGGDGKTDASMARRIEPRTEVPAQGKPGYRQRKRCSTSLIRDAVIGRDRLHVRFSAPTRGCQFEHARVRHSVGEYVPRHEASTQVHRLASRPLWNWAHKGTFHWISIRITCSSTSTSSPRSTSFAREARTPSACIIDGECRDGRKAADVKGFGSHRLATGHFRWAERRLDQLSARSGKIQFCRRVTGAGLPLLRRHRHPHTPTVQDKRRRMSRACWRSTCSV